MKTKTISARNEIDNDNYRNMYWKKYVSLIQFQYRRLFTTWTSSFIILGPFGLLILTAFVVPSESLMYLIMGVGILTTAFFQFGYTYREWKQNPVIRNNMKLSNQNIVITLLSFLSFSIVVILVGVMAFLGLSYLWFYVLNIGNHKDDFFVDANGNFVGYNWSYIFYITTISIFVSISVAYFFESITSSSTTYTMLATFYIMAGLFGGGFMNTSFMFLSERGASTWVRMYQIFYPHWWINYFSLYFFSNSITMSQALSWNSDLYHNLSLIVPWLYATVLFTTAAGINIIRFGIR